MRRLPLLVVVAFGLAACGGSGGSKSTLKITFGTVGGTMVPSSTTIAPSGALTRTGGGQVVGPQSISSSEAAKLSDLVRKDFPNLKSQSCPGTFPDESAQYITALGKTITVRGTCEPAFTNLFSALTNL